MIEIYLHDISIENVPSNPKSTFPDLSKIQIYGANVDGHPVLVNIDNFRPWLYLQAVPGGKSLSQMKSEFSDEFWFKNVRKCEIVKRKRLMGFSDNQLFEFLRLEFTGIVPLYCGRKAILASGKVDIFEDKVDPVLKFFHQTHVRPSAFFGLKTGKKVTGKSNGVSNCEVEYTVRISDIDPMTGDDRPPPKMMMCAYDIESSGLNPKDDFVFQVSMCFSRVGDDVNSTEEHASTACKDGVVICVGNTESIDGTPILVVENEKELLEKFRDILVEKGVMVLIGYNSWRFDGSFMYKRATDIYSFEEYRKLGFIREDLVKLEDKVLESSALGRTELSRVMIPGRIEFDGLMVLRRTHKLSSYKLNSVCEKFFGGNKDDITYADILEACRGKDPHKLGVIAKYCFQDSWLVLRLIDKVKEIYNSIEMSKLCMVPLTYILGRGQQIKCYSLILDKIHGEFVCNYTPPPVIHYDNESDKKKADKANKFQGATVIDAKKGFYPDDPIVCMDFASLYPSIMRWKQLCYTTYITEDKYRNIDGVTYDDYETSPGKIDTFAYRKGEKSVLCALEDSLIDERKKTKKLMKSEKDPLKYGLLDSKQLAQKVTCNSLYGFTGTNYGMLPLKCIAAAVTSVGRNMIIQTSEYAEKNFGANIVYGDTDSVMVIFPVPDEVKSKGDLAVMEYLFKKGEDASAEITNLFGHPVLLEFENIYTRYLLVSKKRYAGLSWTSPGGPPTICMKGLVTVRRDNAPMVSKCATELLRLLLVEKKNGDDIVKYVRSVLMDLEKGRIPIDDLVIRKELTKWEYSNPVPHSTLAKKIKDRATNQRVLREVVKPLVESRGGYNDSNLCVVSGKIKTLYSSIPSEHGTDVPIDEFVKRLCSGIIGNIYTNNPMVKECEECCQANLIEASLVSNGINNRYDLDKYYSKYSSYDDVDWDAPRLGDRIPYVVIRGSGDINGRVEDPEYVAKMPNLKTDTLYYVSRQLKNPLSDLMKLFIPESKVSIFTEFERRAANTNNNVREITSFFTPAKRVLEDEEGSVKKGKTT